MSDQFTKRCPAKPAPISGFPPGMFERGGPKGVGGLGKKEKKNQRFKFECLIWPFLAEITAKSGIYFHFLCQQGGDIPLCGADRGGPDPPLSPGSPLVETLDWVAHIHTCQPEDENLKSVDGGVLRMLI